MKQTSSVAFSSDWLTLREPIDHASRNEDLLAQAVRFARSDTVVTDLGSGTGSTARAFTDPKCQTWTWRFVDSDQDLLNIAKTKHPTSALFAMDLKNINALPFDDVDLVTASALLDLMPLQWVSDLARRLHESSIAFYAAINYNGAMHWTPEHGDDNSVTEAFNRHQRTDKGLGPALGPTSATETANIFIEHGYEVKLADSPWTLGSGQTDLHLTLIDGIGDAAVQCGHPNAHGWAEARKANALSSTGYIGHTDLLAMPNA